MPESMYFSFSKNQLLLVSTSSTALTILAHVILFLHQCGPSLIVCYRVPSCAIWCVIKPCYKNSLTIHFTSLLSESNTIMPFQLSTTGEEAIDALTHKLSRTSTFWVGELSGVWTHCKMRLVLLG